MNVEFQAFPKIARLNRNITITEKIDGTNGAVVIVPLDEHVDLQNVVVAAGGHAVYAQSRTRFITPGNDNYGFAHWVRRNAEILVNVLGAGTHFGEWWGAGIQRRYGLAGTDKRFSLFNTARYADRIIDTTFADGTSLSVVPVLYQGPFSQKAIDLGVDVLRVGGSYAAPGFMKPEGIVIYHEAARQAFKVTLEGDEAPKGAAGHALDIEKVAA